MVPKEVPKFHPPNCRKRDLYQHPKVFKELDDYVFAVRIVTGICRLASIWKFIVDRLDVTTIWKDIVRSSGSCDDLETYKIVWIWSSNLYLCKEGYIRN